MQLVRKGMHMNQYEYIYIYGLYIYIYVYVYIYIYASIYVYNLNFESTTWFSSKAGHKGRNLETESWRLHGWPSCALPFWGADAARLAISPLAASMCSGSGGPKFSDKDGKGIKRYFFIQKDVHFPEIGRHPHIASVVCVLIARRHEALTRNRRWWQTPLLRTNVSLRLGLQAISPRATKAITSG